jgi:ABC-type uncharacterized transport system ATPase component
VLVVVVVKRKLESGEDEFGKPSVHPSCREEQSTSLQRLVQGLEPRFRNRVGLLYQGTRNGKELYICTTGQMVAVTDA